MIKIGLNTEQKKQSILDYLDRNPEITQAWRTRMSEKGPSLQLSWTRIVVLLERKSLSTSAGTSSRFCSVTSII